MINRLPRELGRPHRTRSEALFVPSGLRHFLLIGQSLWAIALIRLTSFTANVRGWTISAARTPLVAYRASIPPCLAARLRRARYVTGDELENG